MDNVVVDKDGDGNNIAADDMTHIWQCGAKMSPKQESGLSINS